MSWMHISEAGELGPSLATWKRRIAAEEVPSKLDPETGRRLVWVAPETVEPSRSDILEELRLLRSEVGELREQLRTRPAEVSTIDPLPERRPQRLSGPSFKAPRASEPTPDQSTALGLLRRAVGLYGGVTAAARELGLSQGLLSNWLNGKKAPSSSSCSRVLARAAELGLDQADVSKEAA